MKTLVLVRELPKIVETRYSTSRWQLLSENINLWKIQSQQQSSKPVAQNEVPVDFVILSYIIAVNLCQLWEIFRCFREPNLDTENTSRGCNKLF